MFKFALLAAASLVAAPAVAASTVIDFDTLTTSDGYSYVYGPYKEDGFTLTSSSCSGTSLGSLCYVSAQAFQDIDPAGASVVNYIGGATSTLTRDDGSAFMLDSIDVSEYFDDQGFGTGTMSALLTFGFADGTSRNETFTFSTIGRYPVSTLTFDLAALTSFGFTPTTGTSGFLQFDNITVSDVAAVPEPATWAMMIGGFGLVGGAMRRRRAPATAIA